MYMYTHLVLSRAFPIDMAGFAVSVDVFKQYPNVWVGKKNRRRNVKIGYMETKFLEIIGTTKESVECRSDPAEVCEAYMC